MSLSVTNEAVKLIAEAEIESSKGITLGNFFYKKFGIKYIDDYDQSIFGGPIREMVKVPYELQNTIDWVGMLSHFLKNKSIYSNGSNRRFLYRHQFFVKSFNALEYVSRNQVIRLLKNDLWYETWSPLDLKNCFRYILPWLS